MGGHGNKALLSLPMVLMWNQPTLLLDLPSPKCGSSGSHCILPFPTSQACPNYEIMSPSPGVFSYIEEETIILSESLD